MEHPGIATVFDADEASDGRPFFAMEYVPGEPITRFADRQRLTVPERLDLFCQVCEAVSHAHGNGVIHRDLTAADILALSLDGRPTIKIIDFGIATAGGKESTPGTELLGSMGQAVGTRRSMSPEQVAGREDLDERTAVYTLGVLLGTLLAGARPRDPVPDLQEVLRCLKNKLDDVAAHGGFTLGGQWLDLGGDGSYERRRGGYVYAPLGGLGELGPVVYGRTGVWNTPSLKSPKICPFLRGSMRGEIEVSLHFIGV